MRLLLDTHTFLWFINDDSKLSQKARSLLTSEANILFVSTASLWEMAIKISLGKLTVGGVFEGFVTEQLSLNGMEILPINLPDLNIITTMPFHHRDPFDRLLIAQAIVEEIPIVSADEAFDTYGIERLW
jgi:PIN domain nuclease of toxin-antitoxin system